MLLHTSRLLGALPRESAGASGRKRCRLLRGQILSAYLREGLLRPAQSPHLCQGNLPAPRVLIPRAGQDAELDPALDGVNRAHTSTKQQAVSSWSSRTAHYLPGASAEGQCGDEPRRLPDLGRLLEGERELDERCLAEAAPDKGDVNRQPRRNARWDADERVPDARSR
jgi:hypothetical protein